MGRLMKKKWIFLISFLLAVISCERKFEFFVFDCEDCYQEKPDCGPLIIYFSFNDENDFVLYTF